MVRMHPPEPGGVHNRFCSPHPDIPLRLKSDTLGQGNPNSMPDAGEHIKSGGAMAMKCKNTRPAAWPTSDPSRGAPSHYRGVLPTSNLMLMANETTTMRAWQKLSGNRIGRALFSVGMVARAPYFGTIVPTVQHVEPGLCEVSAPKWFGVHNHIGTFHAIAACNLAEVAMGLLSEATVPPSHRWIPKGMKVQYLAKAETRLHATAHLAEPPDFATITEGTEVVVPIAIRDNRGAEVVHAEITTWVTPRR